MVWRKFFRSGNITHKIRFLQGDITEMETDAIVNAANIHLTLGAGVAGAIRRKGGPSIQTECDKIGGTHVGGAVLTNGGHLKAKYVIHAVGPIWGETSQKTSVKLLKDAVLNSLKILEQYGLKSIAFPAISTGIFGFPKELAARTMIHAVSSYIQTAPYELEINFVLFSAEDFYIFTQVADDLLKKQ